ncbi:hypothetical protein FKM82_015887 [Ascaphus truei]
MHRKDSKRKSRLEFPSQIQNNNGSCVPTKGRPRQSRRRMTCPSPAEINKAIVAVTLAQLGKGCSLEELMEKCIQSFDPDGKLWRNEQTIHMTLVMHSWVVPSAEFAQKLLQQYREASEKQCQRRLQICHFVRFWIAHYPEVFRLDSKLEEMMSVFWEVMKEGGGQSRHCPIDTSHVLCASLDQESMKRFQGSPSFNKKRKVSLLFDHLEPSELADHLSYLEFKCFCRISKLRKQQNFNTLMAVIGGLCHSAISRLKETHTHLSQDVLKTLSEMAELLSSSSNYSTYRRVYNECGGFKIPILGVQLKDLVSLNEALPDYLDNGKINLCKLQSLYQHILELKQLQKADQPFQANKDLVLLLTSSLDLFHTEDEIYALSYAREPRSHKRLPSNPYKPPAVISQWTPEVPLQPDHDTLISSVEQMVEAVFKYYDPEQCGFVSLADFEKIVASLPFSCNILEKDREGPVNRQEMTAYLMKASHVCAKLGFSFLQSLVETRLKKSPLCASCIWTVAKQGYVCGGKSSSLIMKQWKLGQEGNTTVNKTHMHHFDELNKREVTVNTSG